jgi:hypothetical protein
VKLFVLDTHTIYRRGPVACLDLLEEVESVAEAPWPARLTDREGLI